MENKLCPFCGSKKLKCIKYEGDLSVYIRCENCQADNELNTWNTRPIEDKLIAEIEGLSKALGKYADKENWIGATLTGQHSDIWMWTARENGYHIATEALKANYG